MKHTYILKTLCLFFTTLIFCGCLSDGDETISLEYGNPKTMIIGKWKIKKHYKKRDNGQSTNVSNSDYIDAVWTFFSDGTFTDSSDSYTHRWQLVGYEQGEPYYGDIYLDGDSYGIESLGNGRWVLEQDGSDGYDEYWELEKQEEGDDDDDIDTRSLVSKITAKYSSSNKTSELGTFEYDEDGIVVGDEWDGLSVVVSNSSSTATFKSSYDSYTFSLNSNGYITSWTKDNSKWNISYDKSGYMTLCTGASKQINFSYDSKHTLTSIQSSILTGDLSGLKYTFSNEDNDANIDFNYLDPVAGYLFDGYKLDVYEYAGMLGYLGKRQSKLVSEIRFADNSADFYYAYEYERDTKARISKITRKTMDVYNKGNVFSYVEYYISYKEN